MEEALHDMQVFREFAQLEEGVTRLPDETTFRANRAKSAYDGRSAAEFVRQMEAGKLGEITA